MLVGRHVCFVLCLACAGTWGCGSSTGQLDQGQGQGAGTAAGGAGQGGGQGGEGGGDCTPTPELCNGFDDDCDGDVDEDCPCVQGEEKACYSADPSTNGVGACKSGTQKCSDTGTFGSCDGEVTPGEEVCNKLDDDCNGEVDEGLGEETCGAGACQVTVQSCVDGEAQTCMPGHPENEVCDGIDNNCDGTVDEGCDCINGQKQACYSGAPATQNVGECKDGEQVCADGKWGACQNDVLPQSETCDGKDQNCDGTADDGNPGSGQGCDTGGTGVCKAGLTDCQNGALACIQTLQPSPEKCDGLDNNCNGTVDEGNPQGGASCNTGQQGACALGSLICQAGQLNCVQTNMPQPETCNNVDDDCDGAVDEGNPGGGNSCSTGQQGVCAAGTQTCVAGLVQCVQNQQAGSETCNGLDDDCDGQTDEGNPGGGGNCSTGLLGICSAGMQVCQNGSLQCQQSQQPKPESCNNQDDDCDGQTDEGNPGGGAGCSTGLPGICSAGTVTCQNGSLGCVQNQQPKPEQCGNNADDDCDGQTDENCTVCGNNVLDPGEEKDPPPSPSTAVPLNGQTCRYNFANINQWYCNGTCGNWNGGPQGCDQTDADAFCKLKMDNPNSKAQSYQTTTAFNAPGVCCPPPTWSPGTGGCKPLGVLSSRGVSTYVSVQDTSVLSTHGPGTVITNLVCTNP